MPSDEEKYLKDIKNVIDKLNRQHAEILAKRISGAFTAGFHASKTWVQIGELQKRAIQNLAAENLGYIMEFNSALGDKLAGHLQEVVRAGGGYADIKRNMRPYIEEVFGPNGAVTIDRTGQTRQIIKVDRFGNLHRIEKLITQPYSTTIENYSDMLSRTVAHQSYEKGRVEGYKASGFRKWRFVGPSDERARSWHVALLGKVFEYDTEESDMALEVLSEPNCRHRAVVFFDDPKLDTTEEFFTDQKEKAGLFYNEDRQAWNFKESATG